MSAARPVLEEIDGPLSATRLAALAEQQQPVILRGLVADWPAVAAGRGSASDALEYLRRFCRDAKVGAWLGPADIEGRYFYNDDLTGLNFEPSLLPLDDVLQRLEDNLARNDAPSIYVGSTTIDACLPGFREHNDVDFGNLAPLASIWIGNRSRIAAHYDFPDNIACAVAGRRRFTLFPPEQLENLYVGPLDFTPAGQAISLVDFARPDYARFPRFAMALEQARVAELAPGDAIYVPSMWWHHVEADDSVNVLVNYWWLQAPAYLGKPNDALSHALLSIRELPEAQRAAWQNLFRHYVFEASDDSVAHIPVAQRGRLGRIDDTQSRRLRAELLNKLNR